MTRIFGFDIGTTSIGFAVIDANQPAGTGEVKWLGVRIFPEARDPDGTPLNQARRLKRMARRQLRRRRERRRALNECLADAGLLPRFGSGTWDEAMKMDPVHLRARALDEPLAPHELGRALYHLAKRRHFAERAPGDAANDAASAKNENADEKKAESARETFLQELRQTGETIGQRLATRQPPQRQRGLHANRAAVADEFEKLWRAQAPYHAALQEPKLRARVEDLIFSQRPVFWRTATLGTCRLMPAEPPCPRGSWLSQQRRLLEKLNNLSIVGGNGRPLDEAERNAIRERLETQASVSWGGVRAALKPLFVARGEPGGERGLRFNLEEVDKNGLPGNLIEARLAEIFGPAWATHPHKQAIRDGAPAKLRQADYQEVGQRVVILPDAERQQRRVAAGLYFISEFGVTEAQAAALRDLHLPSGWEPFSTAALQKCLPQLEAGVRFGALLAGPEWERWRVENFPGRNQPTGELLARLPSPGQGTPAQREEQIRIASLRNPTVVRTQNELRKVVNNLIGAFGKPDLIRIELARDVGRSKKDREEKQATDRRLAKRRRDAENELRGNHIEPSRADIEKWLLWQDCNKFDPYSGRAICFDDLFRRGEFEVEHIWPRSASFDDSFGNKTLCLRSLNGRKANRTPFAAFGSDGAVWDAMKKRVWDLVHDGKMSRGKAKRFCSELAMDDDFKARQLNDTGYAARQAVSFLRRLWPDIGPAAPVTVQTVSGRVTAQLRRLWGLNNILSEDGEKTRADHRHHAIDALVVACAHPGLTHVLSRYWQAKDDPAAPKPPPINPPWPDIRAQAAEWNEKMVVSHRVRKKVSGPLHDEMPLGYTKHDVAKGGKTLGVYVKRVPVEKLSLDTLKIGNVSEISRAAKFVVRDDAIRRALLAHLENSGKKPVQAYPPYPRVTPDGPEIRKARCLTVQQKELMVGVANGYVDPANNHHIALYRLASGKTCFEVVSLFEASRRLARHESVVRRDGPQSARFVMSLAAGDTIGIPASADGDIPYANLRVVAGVWASGQIVIRPLNDAVGAQVTQPTITALVRDGYKKVSIDPIGRPRAAND